MGQARGLRAFSLVVSLLSETRSHSLNSKVQQFEQQYTLSLSHLTRHAPQGICVATLSLYRSHSVLARSPPALSPAQRVSTSHRKVFVIIGRSWSSLDGVDCAFP